MKNSPDDEHDDDGIRAMGKQLRSTRRARGLSIEALAKAAGVGAGTVSQYERGMGNPTVQTLRKLADVLDVPLTAFASGPPPMSNGDPHHGRGDAPPAPWTPAARPGRVDVVRADGRRRLTLPGVGPVYDILSPDLDGSLLLMHSVFRVGFDNFDAPFQHVGEEVIVLVEGRLEGRIGDQSVILEAGDTVTFDASLRHGWRTLGDTDASLYSAITPPTLK
ncbi:helix-turn-helix domain-containing protein [Amycolatopsis pithecellobii]|nr:XRE family transcriptional regulator [Amycolatopsis pithecellobii]